MMTMEEPVITVNELVQFLGATPKEIASLRLLFGACDQFDRANAATALMRLRQHQQPAPAPRQGGAMALLRRLRGSNRRVPVEVRRDA
jgi:hypothetical protein